MKDTDEDYHPEEFQDLFDKSIDTPSKQQYNVLRRRRFNMAFSIRLTEEERQLAESYSKLHSISLAEAFKSALFEKIEDEFDITVGQEAYSEYLAEGKKSRPITELWKECDL